MKINCKYDALVKVSELKESPKNRNKHPKEQIDRLVKLFEYQGMRHPIIVSNLSSHIVVGHGRLMAAKKLGVKEVPVVYQDFDNAEQEYAFLISDNAVAEWAELDLAGINTDIGDLGPDFDIDLLGLKDFVIEPIDKLDPQCDEDEVPEVKEPRSVLGDLYELGSHRLLCGDSTSIDAVEKLMNGQKADMVFTDPPYGISIVKTGTVGASANIGFVSPKNSPSQVAKAREYKAREYKAIIGDDEPFDPNLILGLDFKTIILWGANHYASRLPDRPQWLIWDKKLESGSLDHNNFSDCELAWTNSTALAAKIYRHTWAGMLRKGDRKEELKDRVHPTQKPVGLCEQVIADFSKENEIVMDFYGGSGSTLIACEKIKRKCHMMELDPHYIDVIVSRYVKYTGNNKIKLNGEPIEWTV